MTHDNIFESDCEAIVNTINTKGHMGAGLARKFGDRYPEMELAYQHACAKGYVEVGRMWTWLHHGKNLADPTRWIINFPTKDDWRNPSRYDYIVDGLEDLQRVILDLHLKSIAIPALGSGLGGLNWDVVRALICTELDHLTHLRVPSIRIDIYPPEGKHYSL